MADGVTQDAAKSYGRFTQYLAELVEKYGNDVLAETEVKQNQEYAEKQCK